MESQTTNSKFIANFKVIYWILHVRLAFAEIIERQYIGFRTRICYSLRIIRYFSLVHLDFNNVRIFRLLFSIVPRWRLLDSPGKYKVYKNFPLGGLGVVFQSGRHKRKLSGMLSTFNKAKWQIPLWPQNIEVAE